MSYLRAFQYKMWANKELLALGESQLASLSNEDATFFIRILNHTTVVDSLFISRIAGEPEKYTADNTLETPNISALREIMHSHDSWLIDYASKISIDELKRKINFRFVDGENGELNVEEIFLHLLTHGSNHRGMASRVLAENGLERPKDTFTRYIHIAEPSRRT